MVLHHCVSARSFRVLWALEELGAPYDLRVLPFPPRVACAEFLDENPLGTVPLFIRGDVRMTESAAICAYLGATYPSVSG
jgi:glutathione S-transferase